MRKALLDKDLIQEICQYISNGMSQKDAHTLAGVGKTAFYGWIQQGEEDIANGEQTIKAELVEELKKARLKFKMFHINNINKASKTSWQASAWALERMFPKEFGAKAEHSDEDAEQITKIQVEYVDSRTSDNQERLRQMQKQVDEEVLGKTDESNTIPTTSNL